MTMVLCGAGQPQQKHGDGSRAVFSHGAVEQHALIGGVRQDGKHRLKLLAVFLNKADVHFLHGFRQQSGSPPTGIGMNSIQQGDMMIIHTVSPYPVIGISRYLVVRAQVDDAVHPPLSQRIHPRVGNGV